jgi:Fe(3+) dicitrate transport protein
MKYTLLLLSMSTLLVSARAQQPPNDTLVHARSLDSIILISYINQNIVRPLPPISGTYLFSGKKTEVIDMGQLPADITNKTGRQVFAKVPGVFVYDMDGAGNQINIAARGLDPHRGWEFNIRKDGVIANSDMYGYPASHYSIPLESVARVELVRGTGSLQYGAQFGGMLNYVSKQGDTTRPLSFESINSTGSYHLVSSYNAIGGKSGRFRYYAYMQKKSRDGYRDNEHTDAHAEGIILTYQPSATLSIRAEWAHSKYIYRIPGPLTDSMFHADPRQASRSRNYFSPGIHIPSITVNWQMAPSLRMQLVTSAVVGKRNSVMFDKPTNIRDTINAATLDYNNRQIDIDAFNSYTTELRLVKDYRVAGRPGALLAGVQYMNNDLHRTQLGKGTTGSDYDMTLLDPAFGRDVHLKTHNIAVFAENTFQLSKTLSLNAGARVETGRTDMSGTIVYYPDNAIPVSMSHHFPLLGINASYKPSKNMEMYGGWAQAYHPMLFKDLIPASLYEKVDPAIRDSKGYNAELGFRGNWSFLRWDVNAFLLKYNSRFGTLAQTDGQGNLILYRTNIGNSLAKGLEMLLQADWLLGARTGFSVFTSTAIVHARYGHAIVKSGSANVDIEGNKVETAPDLITRNGVTFRFGKASISALYSYTSSSFADALNTVEPLKSTGAVGLVPSYGLLDLNAAVRLTKNIDLKVNVNNVTDRQYFTKRPSFYPGPGVWPSEGRNLTATIGVRL